jgi:hypothetical protein
VSNLRVFGPLGMIDTYFMSTPGSGGTYVWVDPMYDIVGVYFSLLHAGAPGMKPGWRADLFSNMVMAAILDR